MASDHALISAEAQYFSLQGVEQALEVIELARENLNPDLEWLGVVLNIADMRTRHSREAFDSLRQHFGEKLLDTTIRSSIAYAESAERACRSSTTGPTSPPTTWRSPRNCSAGSGSAAASRRAASLADGVRVS